MAVNAARSSTGVSLASSASSSCSLGGSTLMDDVVVEYKAEELMFEDEAASGEGEGGFGLAFTSEWRRA